MILCSGATDAKTLAYLADEKILLLSNIDRPTWHASCGASGIVPIRDVRTLLAGAEQLSQRRIRLRGAVLQGGLGNGLDEMRVTPNGTSSGANNCYVHLRAVRVASVQQPSSAAQPSSSAGRGGDGGGVVLLACGTTEEMAGVTAGHVKRCLHRLERAMTGSLLLPGGGACELACAASLERMAALLHTNQQQQEAAEAKAGGGVGGGGDDTRRRAFSLRAEGLLILSEALIELVRRRMLNAGASDKEATEVMARSMGVWRSLDDKQTRRVCTEKSGAKLWAADVAAAKNGDALYAPLLAFTRDQEEAAAGHAPVLDVLAVKLAVLRASADVVEQVLVPDTIISSLS